VEIPVGGEEIQVGREPVSSLRNARPDAGRSIVRLLSSLVGCSVKASID